MEQEAGAEKGPFYSRTERYAIALRSIEALRKDVLTRGDGEVSTAEVSVIWEEVDQYLSVLKPEEKREFARWQDSARQAMEVKQTYPQIGARLGGLIRGLEARQATMNGKPAGAGSEPLLPSEAALLSAVSEKFYGSWQFKGLSLAIVAAIPLAIGGSLVLGQQTYSLSDRLNTQFTTGRDTIASLQNTAEKAIKEESALVTQTTHDLQSSKTQVDATLVAFGTSAQTAQQKLDKTVNDFTRDLEAKSVAQVIGTLHDQLASKTGVLTGKIDAADRDLAAKLAGLGSRYDAANEKLKTQEADLETSRPKIDVLGAQVDGALAQIHQIQAAAQTVATDAQNAGAASQRATDASNTVTSLLQATQAGVSTQAAAVNSLVGRIATMNAKLNDAESLVPTIMQNAATLVDLGKKIDQLDGRIRVIEGGPKQPPETLPPVSVSPHGPFEHGEQDLTADQKCLIQRELLGMKGTGNVKVDGDLTGSRSAIAVWQASLNLKPADGTLTAAEIPMLIGTDFRPPSCPSSPQGAVGTRGTRNGVRHAVTRGRSGAPRLHG